MLVIFYFIVTLFGLVQWVVIGVTRESLAFLSIDMMVVTVTLHNRGSHAGTGWLWHRFLILRRMYFGQTPFLGGPTPCVTWQRRREERSDHRAWFPRYCQLWMPWGRKFFLYLRGHELSFISLSHTQCDECSLCDVCHKITCFSIWRPWFVIRDHVINVEDSRGWGSSSTSSLVNLSTTRSVL